MRLVDEDRNATRTGVVYIISCSGSDKVYVGSTVNAEMRRCGHFFQLKRGNHHSIHLQRSFNKNGEDAFTFRVVEVVEDVIFLRAREQFWMWRHDGRLYNSAPRADGCIGVKQSPETCAKQAVRMKGNTYRRGARMSLEWVTAHTEKMKGNQHRSGKPHTREDRAKISEGGKQAIATGRRADPTHTLVAFREAVARGEVPNPIVNYTRNDEWMRMLDGGATLAQIADLYGMDRSGVRKTLLGYMKRLGRTHKSVRQRNVEILAAYRSGFDARTVAQQFGVSRSVVSNLILRYSNHTQPE